MSKLTNAEKDKLDNTCGNLRVTKLGTHVKSLEDFVNEMQLDTEADTVAEAINELYHMFVNKDCSSIQIPPPGFFTLWGNDDDGKLYCYYNDKDHPPQFRHVETPGDDEGTLYLYIADPEGDNHYELEVGQYIAVKHLEDYYTKTEIQNGYAIKNHAVNAATYGKGTDSVFGHLKVANNLTTTSTDAIALAAAQGKVLKDLVDGKADDDHKHVKADITDFPSKVSAFTNDKGYLTSHQSLNDYAKTAYVDQQIANIEGDIEVDFASKADTDHQHGKINKDGVISGEKSKNVVTDSNGKITTEDKPTIPSANNTASNIKMNGTQNAGSLSTFAKADHVHPSDTTKVDKVTGKGLSANDFTDTLKAKLDAIEAQANKYSHPATHASSMIIEASALNNIGSAKNADQHTVNDKINTALGTKVDKITGKGLSTNDFTDDDKNAISTLQSDIEDLAEKYYRNSLRIKIGRWSDNQGEDGTKIVLQQGSGDGIYAKLYCDKSDFSLNGRDVVIVLNGVPYIHTTGTTGKTDKRTINLDAGTYLLTAFIRGYDTLYPASDQKIIIVE